MISGWGSSKPKAIFIIDSPTADDLAKGMAMSGYTSKLINEFLIEQNLNPKDFYYTALHKEKLILPEKKKDVDKLYQSLLSEDGYSFTKILSQEITGLQPFLLVPLGELSFRFCSGLVGIRKYRGSILKSSPRSIGAVQYKTLPILGPNPYLNQEYKLRFLSRIDFGKIPRYLNDGPIPDDGINLWIAKTSEQVSTFLTKGYKLYESGGTPFVVFDIETYMGIPTCISFCFDGKESCTIPILDWNIDFASRAIMLSSVAKFLSSPIPKVNQNIKYDIGKLERYGFNVQNVHGDTMLAASCIYPEFAKNLGLLTSIYTDLPYHKDEGKDYDPKTDKRDKFYLYCAKDSLATYQIISKQAEDLKEQGSQEVYNDLVKCLPIFRKMEKTGMLISADRRLAIQAKYDSRYRIEKAKAQMMIGDPKFNPLSSLQCNEIVYKRLGFKPVKIAKVDSDGDELGTTGEEELESLFVFSEPKVNDKAAAKQFLKIIINCRKLHKVKEIVDMPIYPDGRFRGEWNLAGTKNGRCSTGKCTDEVIQFDEKGKIELARLGFPFHNLGKHGFTIDGIDYGQDIRSMFIADNGYTFVEIDLSGAEARVDRVLSGCFDMEVFDNPGIHKLTGSWVYDCRPDEIDKKKLVDGVNRYLMSKTIRHAGERNMTPPRLVLMTQRPIGECKILLDKFHKYQPEIRGVFHYDIRKVINDNRRLVAPNGRCRDFFDRVDEHTYNEAISYLPQVIVGDQMKFTFPLVWGEEGWEAKNNYSHLVFEAHDGMMALVREGMEEEFISNFNKSLLRPIDFSKCSLKRNYELTIPSESGMGKIWSEVH
jgi:uracil-DNA glycosylase